MLHYVTIFCINLVSCNLFTGEFIVILFSQPKPEQEIKSHSVQTNVPSGEVCTQPTHLIKRMASSRKENDVDDLLERTLTPERLSTAEEVPTQVLIAIECTVKCYKFIAISK